MLSLRVALATKMTERDNDRLRLQELEALDKKRLQAPWGVLAPLLLFILAGYAHALGLFLWDLRYSIPVRA